MFYFLSKSKRLRSFGRTTRLSWLLVGLLSTFWALLVSQMAIAHHQSFSNSGNDLGVYTQIIWATGEGKPFYTSLTRETTNFLGHHFVPVVAFLAPFYRLWPDARFLLVAQAILLAAAAFPLFAFAHRRLGERYALLVVLAYFLYPALAFIVFFEFHEIALSVLPLMAAGAALLEQKGRATLFWLVLAMGTKEEVALIAIAFGLYALLIQQRGRFGGLLSIGALSWSLFLFGWLMPSLNQLEGNYTFAQRYASLGGTPLEIILTIFTHPMAVMALIMSEIKKKFVFFLFSPLAGLPLLGLPATLLALPTLAYLLLSDYELQVQISKHYSAPLLPFLFLSTVVALQRLQNWHPRAGQLGTLLLLLASLFGAYSFSPLPGGGRYQPEQLVVSPEDKKTQALLEALPSDAKIASEWRYFPWLANREVLDSILNPNFRPINRVIPDYIVTSPPTTAAITAPTYPWLAPELFELDDKPLRLPRYKVEQTLPDGTMLWQRRPDEEDIWLERVNAPFEHSMILVGAAIPPEIRAQDSVAEEVGAQKRNALGQIQILAGSSLPIWLAWGASEPQGKRITFTIQLWDSNKQRVAQIDQEMGNGSFPTTHWHDWLKQPVVVGEYPLFLPPELPSAQYHLMAGAYESESVTPLLQSDGNGWVELGTIVIKE